MSGKYAPMSPEDHALIVKYASKKSGTEIALMLGCKASKVYDYAHRNSISLRKSGQYHNNAKLTDLQAEMVKALGQAGFSDTEINKSCFPHLSRGCIAGVTKGVKK